jgi:hypothetical protein
MMFRRTFSKVSCFVLMKKKIWSPLSLLFLIGQYAKKNIYTLYIYSLKLLSKLKSNLTGMMFGRSSTNIPHFILIRQKTWLPPETCSLVPANIQPRPPTITII